MSFFSPTEIAKNPLKVILRGQQTKISAMCPESLATPLVVFNSIGIILESGQLKNNKSGQALLHSVVGNINECHIRGS